jgi:antitoxin CptB
MAPHARAVESPVESPVIGAVERRRLRWRARRGLLENDIIVSRYLDRYESSLSIDDVLALEALLDLPDGELFDLLLGRKEPAGELDNNAVRTVLGGLRAA